MRKGAARKKKRMMIVFSGLAMLGVAVALVLTAFQDNIDVFYGPTEVAAGRVDEGTRFRLGGLVEGCRREGTTFHFGVTDNADTIEVVFTGILPDLFREGQGIVATGSLDDGGRFQAVEVLAKHDENYMPTEAVEAMKRAGTWKEGADAIPIVSGEKCSGTWKSAADQG